MSAERASPAGPGALLLSLNKRSAQLPKGQENPGPLRSDQAPNYPPLLFLGKRGHKPGMLRLLSGAVMSKSTRPGKCPSERKTGSNTHPQTTSNSRLSNGTPAYAIINFTFWKRPNITGYIYFQARPDTRSGIPSETVKECGSQGGAVTSKLAFL